MFDRESQPTITESVEESADSEVESADSTTDSVKNPLEIRLWVWAFNCLAENMLLAFILKPFWKIVPISLE